MPTYEWKEGYAEGFIAGRKSMQRDIDWVPEIERGRDVVRFLKKPKRKSSRRKLSAWNKFVKANSKKPRFILRSGKLNLKKMGVAFRKTPASRKK